MSEKSESAYGRRDIIKKTAVAGAVAWTAPMIVSSRAFAALPSDEQGPLCDKFYMVKIDIVPTLGTLHCLLNKGYVQANPTTTVVSSGSYREGDEKKNDAGGGSFTLTADVTLVAVIGKKRDDECNDSRDGQGALSPVSVSPAVSGPGGTYQVSGGQSHIIVLVCSDKVFSGNVINQGVESRALAPLDPALSTQTDPIDGMQTDQAIVEPAPTDLPPAPTDLPPALGDSISDQPLGD